MRSRTRRVQSSVDRWLDNAGRQPLLTPAGELHLGALVREWQDWPGCAAGWRRPLIASGACQRYRWRWLGEWLSENGRVAKIGHPGSDFRSNPYNNPQKLRLLSLTQTPLQSAPDMCYLWGGPAVRKHPDP